MLDAIVVLNVLMVKMNTGVIILFRCMLYRYRPIDELLRFMRPKQRVPLSVNRQLQLETINDTVAFACNRGLAVRKSDTIVCLCPPAYYGPNCEFHSDRLSFYYST